MGYGVESLLQTNNDKGSEIYRCCVCLGQGKQRNGSKVAERPVLRL